jgi:hypothetical protein
VCLCETFENLKVQVKRVTFVIIEKPRIVFVKSASHHDMSIQSL